VHEEERNDRRAHDRAERRSETCRAAAVGSVRLCRAIDQAVSGPVHRAQYADDPDEYQLAMPDAFVWWCEQ
ncbi:hypothetical protein M3182_25710, partial [Mesobacillus maritimus]